MRSSVSSTRGFSAASIAASDMLAPSSSSSSSSSSSPIGLPSASSSVFVSSDRAGAALPSTTGVSPSSSIWSPNVVSRSMTSRSRMSSDKSSSRQIVMAWKVSGLSQRPRIMVLRPASMRLAMAISPSRDSSSTEPISRRYMRTGSSVRSSFSLPPSVVATSPPFREASTTAVEPCAFSSSSSSSASTMLMPISESIDMTSSICSDDTCSGGKT